MSDDWPFMRQVHFEKDEPAWKRKLWDLQERLEDKVPVRLLRFHENFQPRRHLRRWVERAHKGYSREDAWGLHAYLARVIAGGVREIHKEGHGNPVSLDYEEWQGMLLEIAEGFELLTADELPRSNVEKAKIARAKALFAEWFEHLWD